MKTRDELLGFLDSLGVAHATLEHPAVFRVGEGDEIKHALPGGHTKNLFLKDSRGQLWLISALGETKIDLKRAPEAMGSGRLSFANEALMLETLGVTPGSVTALGLINDVDHRVNFVLDAALAAADPINFHPLTNTATTTLSQAGFRTYLSALGITPRVVDFERMARIDS